VELNSRYVNWGEEWEDWDLTCPVCDGEGYIEIETETVYYFCDNEDCDNYEGNQSGPGPCSACGEELYEDIDYEYEEIFCEDCDERGYLEPMLNTVWELNLYNVSRQQILDVWKHTGCAVVYSDIHTGYYLALMGCGMDLTPSLASALAYLGFSWMPPSWALKIARDPGYAAYVAGRDRLPVLKKMIENVRYSLQSEADSLSKALKAKEWEVEDAE
jgi:hypothetical protein